MLDDDREVLTLCSANRQTAEVLDSIGMASDPERLYIWRRLSYRDTARVRRTVVVVSQALIPPESCAYIASSVLARHLDLRSTLVLRLFCSPSSLAYEGSGACACVPYICIRCWRAVPQVRFSTSAMQVLDNIQYANVEIIEEQKQT